MRQFTCLLKYEAESTGMKETAFTVSVTVAEAGDTWISGTN
jgi:hypothetical protein